MAGEATSMTEHRGRLAPETRSKNRKGSRFDIGTLRELAGARAFERGEKYFCDDQVEIVAIEHDRVLAQVAGTRTIP